MKKLIVSSLLMVLFMSTLSGCFGQTPAEEPNNKTPEEMAKDEEKRNEELKNMEVPEAEAASFGEWKDIPVSYKPSVEDYEIASDLSNVEYAADMNAPEGTAEVLAENGFAVTGGYYDEYFSLYEDNRYNYMPSFVTTDSVLHTYHLYFNYLLKQLEENELYDLAVKNTEDMLKVSLEQYEQAKGSEFQTAAKRNVAYFAIVMKLLDDNMDIPEIVKSEVEADLALIEDHKGIEKSSVMSMDEVSDYSEDFSQYIPRGHYNKSDKLKQYFKALMWYGRVTFRLSKGDETRSALLIIAALKDDDSLRNDWKKLYEPIGFFVGDADDLVYLDYAPLAVKIFGEDNLNVKSYIEKFELVADFVKKAKELRDPGVNSMPVLGTIFAPEQTPEEAVEARTDETKGFRYLGQRFTIDASIFQKLICREVGNKDGTMPCPQEDSRMLPNGLDIPAAFGSKTAYSILDEMGETDYAKYPENMKKLQDGMAQLPKSQWTANLYWGWMYTLQTLLKDYGEGYPMFMQNDNWKKKELITFLGSWAELKHDTILYAKQVYAELGGMMPPEERDDRGFVEPNPELYARLASLTDLTITGLDERDILSTANKEQLEKLSEMLVTLKDISIKELENTKLTDEEYEFIRSYGGSLEHFWYETFSDEEKEQGNLLNDNPAAIIADVATDPNCCVLEVGTGRVDSIFVVFPIDGKLRIAKGGVYSYYEFSWPMDDRLTDEKWRDEILTDYENMPERPDWQLDYINDYEY